MDHFTVIAAILNSGQKFWREMEIVRKYGKTSAWSKNVFPRFSKHFHLHYQNMSSIQYGCNKRDRAN